MVAITNYATLLTEVADELDRDDLADLMPRLIDEVESDLKRRLRTLDMETVSQSATSSEDTALPADFLQMRSIHVEGTPDRPLKPMSPAGLVESYDGTAGTPEAYAIIGETLRLAPPPSAALTLRIVYWAAFTGLSGSNATNWLVTDHPDIYLNGVAALACRSYRDMEGFAIYQGAYDRAVESLKSSRNRDRWGGGPLAPVTVIRGIRNIRA